MEPIFVFKAQKSDGIKQVKGDKALLLSTFQQAFRKHGNVVRWLEDGQIIRFTNVRFTEKNAEFTINENENHKMWFSQFDDIFLNPFPSSKEDLAICSPVWQRFHEDPWSFWEYVKGKTFKVSIVEKYCCIINFKSPNCPQTTYRDAMEYYLNNFLKNNYQAIDGILKQARCYNLVEL